MYLPLSRQICFQEFFMAYTPTSGVGALQGEWGSVVPSLVWAEMPAHVQAAASGSPVRFLLGEDSK